jgi:hypothetical protein
VQGNHHAPHVLLLALCQVQRGEHLKVLHAKALERANEEGDVLARLDRHLGVEGELGDAARAHNVGQLAQAHARAQRRSERHALAKALLQNALKPDARLVLWAGVSHCRPTERCRLNNRSPVQRQ